MKTKTYIYKKPFSYIIDNKKSISEILEFSKLYEFYDPSDIMYDKYIVVGSNVYNFFYRKGI